MLCEHLRSQRHKHFLRIHLQYYKNSFAHFWFMILFRKLLDLDILVHSNKKKEKVIK